MPLRLLPSLLALVVVIGFTPGPASIFSLTCSIRYGRERAMRMWLGLLVGFTIAMLIIMLVMHFIGEAMGRHVIYIKYVGSAYIVYLAVRMFISSGKPSKSRHDCTFLSGVIIQFTNAKMLVFDIMVFSTFVLPYSDSFASLLPVGAILEIAGPGSNLVWLLIGTVLHKYVSKKQKTVDIIMAICLLICAVVIVI